MRLVAPRPSVGSFNAAQQVPLPVHGRARRAAPAVAGHRRCRRDGSGGPAVGTAAGELPEAFTAAGDAALLVKQEAGKAGLVEA